MKTHKALQQLIQSAAILAILLSLSVYASENTKHQHVHPEKTASKKQQETKKQIQHKMHVSKESADDKVMKNILEKYEQLHQAFFTNKIDSIEVKSNDLIQSISSITDNNTLQTLTDKNVITLLKSIKTSNNKRINNSLFHEISKAIFETLIKGKGEEFPYALFSCPMVFEDKEALWIQNTNKVSEVQNPYRDDMPHCGSQK